MHVKKVAPIFVIIAASMWGIDGILLRPALYTLPVPLVVFLECLIVTLLLTPFFIRKFDKLKNLSAKEWLAFIGVSLFGVVIGTMAITKALFYVNYVNLSIVVLIQKLQPVFTLAGAAVLLKERLPRVFFLWAIIAITGALLMTFGLELPNINTGDKTFMAAVFALIAAVSFSLSTIFSKRALRNIDYGIGTYLRFLISVVILLGVVSATGDFKQIGSVSAHQILIFFLIALSTGILSTILYYFGLKSITASLASICELAFPLTAVLLEFILRGNLLSSIQWLGVFLLFIAIFRVTRAQKS